MEKGEIPSVEVKYWVTALEIIQWWRDEVIRWWADLIPVI